MEKLLISLIVILSFLISTLSILSQQFESNTEPYQLEKSLTMDSQVNSWMLTVGTEFTENPILAIAKKEISRIDKATRSLIELPENYLSVIFSKGGNFFAVIRTDNTSARPNDYHNITVEVFRLDGKKIYSISRSESYDDVIPIVVVSDRDGAVIIGQNSNAQIWFYDPAGELIERVSLFQEIEYDLERNLSIDVSSEGNTVAVVSGQRGSSPAGSEAINPSAEPQQFLFTSDGELLWKKELTKYNSTGTAISPDGSFIATNNYTIDMQGNVSKTTVVFDADGQEVMTIEILFKHAVFSANSNTLLLMENSAAQLVDLSAADLLWRYEVNPSERIITAGSLSENGEIASLLLAKSEYRDGEFIFVEPELQILDHQGNDVQKIEVFDQTFLNPSLKIANDSREIFVGFKNSYQIYRVDQ